MSTTVTDGILRRVFAPGTLVTLEPRDHPEGVRFSGVVAEWRRRACHLTLRGVPEEIDNLLDASVDMLHGRLDGLYRVGGRLRRARRRRPSDPPAAATCRAYLEIVPGSADCRQRRAFYRLSGRWPALIHRPAAAGPAAEAEARPGGAAAARIGDLSAGGMLIDDAEALLALGGRFRATIDLQDGGSPLTVTAVPVRRQRVAAGRARQWGCRFLELSSEDEERILARLHALTRMRLAGAPRPAFPTA